MTTFIGMDGGGTKTAAVAADVHGNILKTVKAGPSNPNGSSLGRIIEELQSIKHQLEPHVDHWKECVLFAGIAGTIHSERHDQMLNCLRAVFGGDVKITLDHDGMNALGSVTYGGPGVIQIAGTGALTFGLGADGQRCRIGGWGYLLGDEGSGFDLGRRALQQVMKAHDGRGPATQMTELCLQKWRLSDLEDLIPLVYSPSFKEWIASFTYELFQAAGNGDHVALTVIGEAAAELAAAIQTALDTLDLTETAALVGLIGGAFQPPLVQALRSKMVEQMSEPPHLIRPRVEPVIGALAWAYKQAGLDPKRLLQTQSSDGTA